MTKLNWDERFFTEGCSRGVLYLSEYQVKAWAWHGLISATEKRQAEMTSLYYEGRKWGAVAGNVERELKISCYTYPGVLDQRMGIVPKAVGIYADEGRPQTFGFTFQSLGSDGSRHVHVYPNLLANPSEREHRTIKETRDPQTIGFDCQVVPQSFKGTGYVTPYFRIDLDSLDSTDLKTATEALYGSDTGDASMDKILAFIVAKMGGQPKWNPAPIDQDQWSFNSGEANFRWINEADGEFEIEI